MNDFNQTLNDCFQEYLVEFQINDIQISPLQQSLTLDFYRKWLSSGYNGSMKYLEDHLPIKENPQSLKLNRLKDSKLDLNSVISLSQPYWPLALPLPEAVPARTAAYAQNRDYHFWLKEKLNKIILKLEAQFPEHCFLPFVDSGPILERDWGYQNGLGWFGKNTCLIHPKKGSFFFIAEILTSLPSNLKNEPLPDFCGKCTKCIDACPTQAIESPRLLNATKCISYLTIEAKDIPDESLRKKMNDWFFGCDICQSVCPWNQKFLKSLNSSAPSDQPLLQLDTQDTDKLVVFLKEILTSSNKQLQKKFKETALARARGKSLKRNALIVIANRKLQQLKTEVENLNVFELDELKNWTLSQLNE